MADNLQRLSRILSNKIVPTTQTLTSNIVKWARNMPKIHDKIKKMDITNLQTELAQQGVTALFTGNATVTQPQADVTINIRVQMSAEQVAYAIAKTKLFPSVVVT